MPMKNIIRKCYYCHKDISVYEAFADLPDKNVYHISCIDEQRQIDKFKAMAARYLHLTEFIDTV